MLSYEEACEVMKQVKAGDKLVFRNYYKSGLTTLKVYIYNRVPGQYDHVAKQLGWEVRDDDRMGWKGIAGKSWR